MVHGTEPTPRWRWDRVTSDEPVCLANANIKRRFIWDWNWQGTSNDDCPYKVWPCKSSSGFVVSTLGFHFILFRSWLEKANWKQFLFYFKSYIFSFASLHNDFITAASFQYMMYLDHIRSQYLTPRSPFSLPTTHRPLSSSRHLCFYFHVTYVCLCIHTCMCICMCRHICVYVYIYITYKT